jgi:hypothetical protein
LGYISTTQLAKLLGVPSSIIEVAHQKGYLPEPPRIGGRRAYGLLDVIKTAAYFGVVPKFGEMPAAGKPACDTQG